MNDHNKNIVSLPGGTRVRIENPALGFAGFAIVQAGGGTRGESRFVRYERDGAAKIVPLDWIQVAR